MNILEQLSTDSKPINVIFSLTKCRPCMTIKSMLSMDENSHLAQHVKILTFDSEDPQERKLAILAEQTVKGYGVTISRVPILVFIGADSAAVEAMGTMQIMKYLRSYHNGLSEAN